MKRTLLGSIAVSAMVMAASPTLANDWYGSLFGGGAWVSPITGQYFGSSPLDLDAHLGFVGGLAVGAYIVPTLRGEFELSFSHHQIDDDTRR